MSRYEELLELECTCHLNPPCRFCVSLSEEEADVFASGGRDALFEYLLEKMEREE